MNFDSLLGRILKRDGSATASRSQKEEAKRLCHLSIYYVGSYLGREG